MRPFKSLLRNQIAQDLDFARIRDDALVDRQRTTLNRAGNRDEAQTSTAKKGAIVMISADVPDWKRERQKGWAPSASLLNAIRAYQRLGSRRDFPALFIRKMAVLRHRYWSVVTGADIPLNSQIEGGLLLPHPNGVVIHPGAKIGPNCLIFQQVTIGSTERGVPTIGGHVDIGAGAKIIGPVTIGDHVVVGANAVVTKDVPSGHTVVGIPARVLQNGSQ